MIRVFKFKKNDLNPSAGKQIEYSVSDVRDFFQFSNDEVTIHFRYVSNIAGDYLNGLKFTSTFKLSPARGDYKCYGNSDGSINLKSFFLDKLHLNVDDNLDDFYALKKVSETDYILSYFPKDTEFSDVAAFFFSQNTDVDEDKESDGHREIPNKSLQLIYYGAPGTGKSFTIDQVTDENNSLRTTFHPDSDYANFVGAYKPTMELVDVAFTTSDGKVKFAKPDKNEDGRLHTGKERKIVYKYVPQAFLKAYVEAWKRYSADEDNPYYLVIEEINRGNCAQIFGDLFQLLDRNNMGCSSYAISADEDIAQFLREDEKGFAERSSEDGDGLTKKQRDNIADFVLKKDNKTEEHIGSSILNGSKLLFPPNLRIWATMNTSDQSLFPIDSAFKRRWNWEYVPIVYDQIDKHTKEPIRWKLEVGGKIYSWGKFLEIINKEIEDVTVSEDKQMGYFFAKPDEKSEEYLAENDTISENVFVNKVLFYLWTDVFKDYDLSKKTFIYQTKDKEGKEVNKAFSFRDFFPIQNNKFLADFMANLEKLGLDPISADKPQSIDELEEEQDIEDNDDTSNLRLTIKFPNGKIIQEPTRFESYLKALEEIGLDRVEPIAAEKKYQRRNAPLVSKTKYSEIEADPVYTYVQSGDYYIVKGTNTRTQRNLLNLVSDKLNLGLEVSVE